jgi:cephalosporin-C deacetylase-like acetyl esterase
MTRNGYQHMVLDDYVEQVRKKIHERRQRLLRIASREQALEYQNQVRKAISRAFGPFPEKTPLNTQVSGVLPGNGYRIETLTYESRPGSLVSANLYVPDNLTSPAPAIVSPCGHSTDGKACSTYQAYCERLARNGFVVLIYDPFNQGERDQYFALPSREEVQNCCHAHNMMGKQLELTGEFFGMWRAWDGIRGLDVLCSRPEVDTTRLGVTGNSGGGTISTWLWALEDRLTMGAPSCFVTSFLTNLENELPADCEQYPPGVIGAGLDMVDFMIARAPNPALLLGQKYDFFERRGLQAAFAELKRFYEILGAGEKTELFIGPQGHGYSIHNQEAMLGFFSRQAGISPVMFVKETAIRSERELYATPEGNTIAAGSTPIFVQTAAKAEYLTANRQPLQPEELRQKLAELLNLVPTLEVPHFRIPRPESLAGLTIARYAVETETGIRAILRKLLVGDSQACCHTLDVENEVTLYLPHTSAEEDMAKTDWPATLPTPEAAYALDVRGLGESMPERHGTGSFFQPYGMDYMFHGHGLLLGRNYLGRRVHDVLAVLNLLRNQGAQTIHLYGRGQGTILALFASLLQPGVASLTLKNGPPSYESWVKAPLVSWPAANCLHGVLRHFDLPDCLELLGDRVQVIEPWGPDMAPLKQHSPTPT